MPMITAEKPQEDTLRKPWNNYNPIEIESLTSAIGV